MEDMKGCLSMAGQWLVIFFAVFLIVLIIIDLVSGGSNWIEYLLCLVGDVGFYIWRKIQSEE